MADQSRLAPIFGALIAATAVIYAAIHRPSQAESPVAPPPPSAMPRPGSAQILADVWADIDRDHVSIMAAGVAFYTMLSIFPGMSALISIYGLIADPTVIERQVAVLSEVLPQDVLRLLSDQLHSLVAAPPGTLGIGLIVSLALALWSATSGTGSLMLALTVAYEEKNTRGVFGFYLRAIALTIMIGIFGLVSLFLIAVVPAAIDWLPIPAVWRTGVALIRWPILAGLAFVALALVYRFAPARQTPHWHWLSPGTTAAAVLWLAGSAGFSFYVARFGSYEKTYGTLGAVVVLLMWLYVSAYIVLVGAELNSAVEKRRR
jgi:membrane protein